MRCMVTGGAGFIGSNLVDRLLADGHAVVVYDNFSSGRRAFLEDASRSGLCRIVEGDVLDDAALAAAMDGCDTVFHLAANADVRFGLMHPRRDLEQNTIATHNVLEAMRHTGAKRIAFSSTGSIYGEPDQFPTPETCKFPIQTSLYGASKLACEGLIQAYAEGFGIQAFIFRFVSVVGERYSHGHIYDFYKKLQADPTVLDILGNGNQKKSYMYVADCIDAILLVMGSCKDAVNIYNLGTDGYCTVKDSAGWICEYLGVNPHRRFSGGTRGWIGDSPFIYLDISKIRSLGWTPKVSIREGVQHTLRYFEKHPFVLESP